VRCGTLCAKIWVECLILLQEVLNGFGARHALKMVWWMVANLQNARDDSLDQSGVDVWAHAIVCAGHCHH